MNIVAVPFANYVIFYYVDILRLRQLPNTFEYTFRFDGISNHEFCIVNAIVLAVSLLHILKKNNNKSCKDAGAVIEI